MSWTNATYDHLVLQEGHQPLDPVVKLMVAQSHGVKIEKAVEPVMVR